MYKVLPSLYFIPVDRLLSHEVPDDIRVQRLLSRIRTDTVLRNPIIAAHISSSDKLLVLDGVTRVEALKELGCRDIITQLADYSDLGIVVTSSCWVMESITRLQIENRLNSLGFLGYSCSFEKGLDDVKNKKAISYFLFRNGDGMKVPFNSQILYERVESLRLVAECFSNIFEIHLINQPFDFPAIFGRFDKGSTICVLPEFSKNDIIAAVENGFHFPFGVTNHIIPERVLGLSIPLSIMASKDHISEKNAYVQELLKLRLSKHRARYYPESVVILND